MTFASVKLTDIHMKTLRRKLIHNTAAFLINKMVKSVISASVSVVSNSIFLG